MSAKNTRQARFPGKKRAIAAIRNAMSYLRECTEDVPAEDRSPFDGIGPMTKEASRHHSALSDALIALGVAP